jgi:hypothetical protein
VLKAKSLGCRDGVEFGVTFEIDVNAVLLAEWAKLDGPAQPAQLSAAIERASNLVRVCGVPTRWATGLTREYALVWFTFWVREVIDDGGAGEWYAHVWRDPADEPPMFQEVCELRECVQDAMVNACVNAERDGGVAC